MAQINLLEINLEILQNPHKRKTEQLAQERIVAWMRENNNSVINPRGVESYFAYCQKSGYRNRYIDNLKGILKKSILVTLRETIIRDKEVAQEYVFSKTIWTEVFSNIRIKKSQKPVEAKQPPSSEEVLRLVENETNPVRALLIAFTYSMGLRNSEVRNIKLSDINRRIEIHNGIDIDQIYICSKNQNERLIPVRSDYIDLIIEIQNPKIWLFERLPGIQFSERTFQRIVGDLSKRVLKRSIHPHLLRHSLATQYYEKTLDVIGGARFLGNNPRTFSETYAHPKLDLEVVNVTDVDRILTITKRKVGLQ